MIMIYMIQEDFALHIGLHNIIYNEVHSYGLNPNLIFCPGICNLDSLYCCCCFSNIIILCEHLKQKQPFWTFLSQNLCTSFYRFFHKIKFLTNVEKNYFFVQKSRFYLRCSHMNVAMALIESCITDKQRVRAWSEVTYKGQSKLGYL